MEKHATPAYPETARWAYIETNAKSWRRYDLEHGMRPPRLFVDTEDVAQCRGICPPLRNLTLAGDFENVTFTNIKNVILEGTFSGCRFEKVEDCVAAPGTRFTDCAFGDSLNYDGAEAS